MDREQILLELRQWAAKRALKNKTITGKELINKIEKLEVEYE